MTISRRAFLSGTLAGCTGLAFAGSSVFKGASDRANQYNVLFVSIDDLRPALGCYNDPMAKTPNIDRLAREGLLFERAYCQQAVCNPSRASLLTGRRPDTTRVYDLQTHFRQTIPGVATLPEHFKNNNFYTACFGKIFHDGLEDAASWSEPKYPERNAGMQYVDEAKLEKIRRERNNDLTGVEIPTSTWQKRESWQAFDAPDDAIQDGKAANLAIEAMRRLKDRRFFLAVGFQKPHLPFVAPRRYFDLFPPESIKLAGENALPKNVPQIALHPWTELRGYTDIPKTGSLTVEKRRELVRAYYAATSYMDAQFGRVMNELERLNLRQKTVVVLWGDHGFHLGEHDLWAKTTNFELDARAPFILSAPAQKANGKRTDALVEFVDIFPTLCELCELPAPGGLEGASLLPLLSNPKKSWKRAAFTQFPRLNPSGANNQIMGRTIRTDRYRYTEWAENNKEPMAIELYDHQKDPHETDNIAALPANKNLILRLRQQLRAGWRAALPPE